MVEPTSETENFIKPRYTDSRQSLETAKSNTETTEDTPHYATGPDVPQEGHKD